MKSERTAAHGMFIVLACIVFLCGLIALGTSYAGQMIGEAEDETPVASSEDLSGDDEPDRVVSKSWNEQSPEPGEVRVETAGGTILFRGIEDDDRFGEVVNPMVDLNGNGHRDLIVGAPGIGRGEVYVFFGPFDEHHPELRDADDADLIFFSPHPDEYDFGARVAPIVDLTGNGFPEIRIGAWRDDPFGEPVSRTYIFRGDTGEPLYFVLGEEPFDAWPWIEADVNDDGVVDQIDVDIAIANLGRSDDVTWMDGDVNEDGEVNQLDLDLIGIWIGHNPIYPDPSTGVIGIPKPIDPCDEPTPPAGYRCIEDCYGESITLPINVSPMCHPPSTCQAYCSVYMSGPEPANVTAPALQSVQFHATSLSNSSFEVIYGDHRILFDEFSLPSGDNNYTFEYLAVLNGPVTIRVTNEVCTYVCEEEFTFFISDDPDDTNGNGIQDWIENCMGTDPYDFYTTPDMEVDSDNDGLPDWYELCVLGTDPNNPDTSGNGLPDGWLYQNGFDLFDFGIAWVDANGNGLPNLLEFLYGTDPHDPDSFLNAGGLPPDSNGNGYIDWLEEVLGSDPSDPDIVPEVVFTPGDMIWAIVDGVFMNLDSEFLNMCVGDCFRLHATGAANSWQVIQGQDLVTEVVENSNSSCWSGMWCIDEPGTILIAGATPQSGGGVTLGYAMITADDCDDDGGDDDDCDIEITPPGGGDLPEFVCAGEQIELTASGAEGVDGSFEWHVMEHATIIGPATGNTILLEIEEPGEIILTVNKGDCGKEIALTSRQLRLVIDSENELGFEVPEYDEESEIDPSESPGKIIFTNIGDRDNDGIPDYADGFGLATNEGDSTLSEARFTPLVVEIDPQADPESHTVMFTYSESDPGLVEVVEQTGGTGANAFTWQEYDLPSSGRFRLWIRDGDQMRSPLSVDEGGDFIRSGEAYALSDLANTLSMSPSVIYIEAVRPSLSGGSDTISITVTNQETNQACTSIVTVTAVEVEVHDLRHWGPVAENDFGRPGIQNTNLHEYVGESRVGGAITDGASICLIRVRPSVDVSEYGFTLRVLKSLPDGSTHDPIAVGRLHPSHNSNGNVWLPHLPAPGFPPASPNKVNLDTGAAFYVPPESYSDPGIVPSNQSVLNNQEASSIEFRVLQQLPDSTPDLGRASFRLRRPPLILIHGLVSSYQTWDPLLWNDSPASMLKTRVYKLDYSDTNTLGYGENYTVLSLGIEAALQQYRSGDDADHHPFRGFQGVRYAATRADVVGHSLGGQLARFYIADGMPSLIPRDGWVAGVPNQRNPESPSGNWPYLRDNNWGAGSIRRLITLGSPFKGSSLGNAVAPVLAPGNAGDFPTPQFTALMGWYYGDFSPAVPAMPEGLANLLFTSPTPPGTYIEPTGVADLSVGSEAQIALESASFPTDHAWVRWYPIVGIATEPVDPGSVEDLLWRVLFVYLPSLPNHPPDSAPLLPHTGDFIVGIASQRNAQAGAGQTFNNTAHVHTPVMEGETTSSSIFNRVVQILGNWPVDFQSSWSLGP